jgi:hypothetical protein
MGWMQSPSLFTAATETVADLANHQLGLNAPCPSHRLDPLSEATPPRTSHLDVVRTGQLLLRSHPRHAPRADLTRP